MEKPRPLNKREFLTTLSEPYVQPEVEMQPYSNPNSTYSIDVQPGQPEFNRALEVSLKDDDVIEFTTTQDYTTESGEGFYLKIS